MRVVSRMNPGKLSFVPPSATPMLLSSMEKTYAYCADTHRLLASDRFASGPRFGRVSGCLCMVVIDLFWGAMRIIAFARRLRRTSSTRTCLPAQVLKDIRDVVKVLHENWCLIWGSTTTKHHLYIEGNRHKAPTGDSWNAG